MLRLALPFFVDATFLRANACSNAAITVTAVLDRRQRGAHRHRLQAAVKSPPHTSLSGTKGQAAHLGKVPPRQPIDSISINVGTLVACELNAPLAIIGAGTPKPMVPFFVIGIPLSNFLLRFIGPAPNPPLSCSPPHALNDRPLGLTALLACRWFPAPRGMAELLLVGSNAFACLPHTRGMAQNPPKGGDRWFPAHEGENRTSRLPLERRSLTGAGPCLRPPRFHRLVTAIGDDIAQCSIEGDEQEMWAEMRRGRTWAAAGDMIMKT